MLIVGHSALGPLLVISTAEPIICQLAVKILSRLYADGRRYLETFDETDKSFQERLFTIELNSSVRRGVFDEGPSFLTHPPHWYSDNSSFEDVAPWGQWPLQERRRYKGRLKQRIEHATQFLDVEEIVSERSIIRYINEEPDEAGFYLDKFSADLIGEHVRHIADSIRDPARRFKFFVCPENSLFIENKSWAAYNDYSFLDRVFGGRNMAVILSSATVAYGFRTVFDEAKRLIPKRFLDPDATADWLLARLSERK
jgi:hypothetical protein